MSTNPSENNHPNENEDKDEDNTKEDENENDRPQEDDEETGGQRQLTDEEELKRAQRTYENSVSACYKCHGLHHLQYHLGYCLNILNGLNPSSMA
ncbi:hypothetical protein Pst134EA_015564 [Puccinia striiformis f. sp. tritici]|uniref:hypothetical protein n=1 Tax=Puccinia striiformis f. sp. tritici TaxID=168172 RepID=UPI0020083CB7|nr:hypothetical protein Pst134EA_015564 [Puccinia striiformis f. sp. tritici]KAH9463481.1 hypothetical protein Pst134EA_015564 [Puccinia striiformis f. sp. tritici]